MSYNYLENYITINQMKYPHTSRTPFEVLDHLFFTNGNGVKFDEDGDMLTPLSFWHYKKTKDVLEGGCGDTSAVEMINFFAERTDDKHTSEAYSNLITVDELSCHWHTPQTLLSLMKLSDWYLLCSISRGYFKGEEVSEDSDYLLQEVYTNCLCAWLLYLEWDGRFDKKPVSSLDIYEREDESKKILKEELKRMSEILMIQDDRLSLLQISRPVRKLLR